MLQKVRGQQFLKSGNGSAASSTYPRHADAKRRWCSKRCQTNRCWRECWSQRGEIGSQEKLDTRRSVRTLYDNETGSMRLNCGLTRGLHGTVTKATGYRNHLLPSQYRTAETRCPNLFMTKIKEGYIYKKPAKLKGIPMQCSRQCQLNRPNSTTGEARSAFTPCLATAIIYLG